MTLQLNFVRHAIAVERDEAALADAERPLTEAGREKMILAVRGMKKLGVGFEVLLSSPLLRARQTAELVAQHLPFKGKIEIEEELAPEGSLRGFLGHLARRKEKRWMLVGHEPALSLWIQGLLGCGYDATLQIKKGCLCRLELARAEEGAKATLLELLQPKSLRALGRKIG